MKNFLRTTVLRAVLVPGVCISVALSSPATADSPYELIRSNEYGWLAGGGVLAAGGLLLTSQMDPLTGAQVDALDPGDINSFDRNHMHPYRADHAGDALAVTSFALPLLMFSRDDVRDDADTIALMWAETNLLSQGLVGIVKPLAKRTRPYAYDPDAPDGLRTGRSARLSFYSGHTAASSANCFFLATVFSDYSDNRNAEVAVWSGAALLPIATAYFRVDSGHHFVTDTIVGYAVGAAAGYLVPALHRTNDSSSGGTTANRPAGIAAKIGAAAGCLAPVARHLFESPVSVQPASVDGAPGFVASVSF